MAERKVFVDLCQQRTFRRRIIGQWMLSSRSVQLLVIHSLPRVNLCKCRSQDGVF